MERKGREEEREGKEGTKTQTNAVISFSHPKVYKYISIKITGWKIICLFNYYSTIVVDVFSIYNWGVLRYNRDIRISLS